MSKIVEDIKLITDTIMNTSNQGFTGKLIITLDMNQGGCGKISVNMDKTLKKGQTPQL